MREVVAIFLLLFSEKEDIFKYKKTGEKLK